MPWSDGQGHQGPSPHTALTNQSPAPWIRWATPEPLRVGSAIRGASGPVTACQGRRAAALRSDWCPSMVHHQPLEWRRRLGQRRCFAGGCSRFALWLWATRVATTDRSADGEEGGGGSLSSTRHCGSAAIDGWGMSDAAQFWCACSARRGGSIFQGPLRVLGTPAWGFPGRNVTNCPCLGLLRFGHCSG